MLVNNYWSSAHLFRQFFLRTTDADVEKYLKMFTLLPVEEIDAIVQEHEIQPEHRLAQKLLAKEVTLMVHRSESQLLSACSL
jgi:tyrosyl-tRNA synthetase